MHGVDTALVNNKKKKYCNILYVLKHFICCGWMIKRHFLCHFTSTLIVASSLRMCILDISHNDINYCIYERHCHSSGLSVIENFLDLYIVAFLLCFLRNSKTGKKVVYFKIIIKSNNEPLIMHKRTTHENIINYYRLKHQRQCTKKEFRVLPYEVKQITFHCHLWSVLLTSKEAAKQLISYSQMFSATGCCY